ncbi:MAG: carboxypeptidase regulatory-like domain-containing protein, partial [Planctomycetes bacterium]|nr:carboxypeptidase regulatory-like domain-containing protein [Planctomycetota bacterium]
CADMHPRGTSTTALLIAAAILGFVVCLALWIGGNDRTPPITDDAPQPSSISEPPDVETSEGRMTEPNRSNVESSTVSAHEPTPASSIIRGVVFDPERKPVAGAHVRLERARTTASEASTGDDGGFEFWVSSMESKPIGLTVEHPAFVPFALGRLEPPLELEIVLDRGREVRGVVLASDGGPIPDAVVETRNRDFGKLRDRPLRNATTDEQGRFSLQGLPNERLWMSCRAENYLSTDWRGLEPDSRFEEIVLTKPARVAGTVVDSATGSPITQFRVAWSEARSAAKERKSSKGWAVWNDPEGHWHTRDAPLVDGSIVDIEILVEGYARKNTTGLVARHGAQFTDHLIEMETGCVLRGRVRADGRPVARAKLELTELAIPESGKGAVTHGLELTDGAGEFTFWHVGSGAIRIVIDGHDTGVHVHSAEIPAGTTQQFLDIQVPHGARIEGVLLEPDRTPVPQTGVILTATGVPGLNGHEWNTYTDDAGRFAFERLPSGRYRVSRTLGVPGKSRPLLALSRSVTVRSGTRVDVELVATGSGAIAGSLIATREFRGAPIIHLEPVLEAGDDSRFDRYETANGSDFEFRAVDPGAYRVHAFCIDADGVLIGTTDVVVKDVGITDVSVAVRPK